MVANAANPSYSSFNQTYFLTNANGTVEIRTNYVRQEATNVLLDNTLSSTNFPSQLWTIITAAGQTTNYFIDFGLTNSAGLPYATQTVFATTNVAFLDITNFASRAGQRVWVNVVMSVGDFYVSFPTNWAYLNTNGLTLAGTRWSVKLVAGQEVLIEAQTNRVLTIRQRIGP